MNVKLVDGERIEVVMAGHGALGAGFGVGHCPQEQGLAARRGPVRVRAGRRPAPNGP